MIQFKFKLIKKFSFTYFADYIKYYDLLICLLQELEMLVPEAKSEVAALIPPVKCQKISINTNDKKLALKCLEDLAAAAVACI